MNKDNAPSGHSKVSSINYAALPCFSEGRKEALRKYEAARCDYFTWLKSMKMRQAEWLKYLDELNRAAMLTP